MSKYWNQRRSEVFKEANAIMRGYRRHYTRHEALSIAWENSNRRPHFYVRCYLDDNYRECQYSKPFKNYREAAAYENEIDSKVFDHELVWDEEADKMLNLDKE